jgi:beta-glucosidase
MKITRNKPLYLDHTKSFEERVEDLVSRLTLEEKISQILHDSVAIERLGIPKYNWWNECLHGVANAGIATVFPQAIGLAASFNLRLIFNVSNVISDEARAKHHEFVRNNKRGIFQGLTFWSPNINIFRDPRWGRGQETYGEDPYLTGKMGIEFVKGLQGNHQKYLKLVATPKHYVAYSGLESERHFFDAKISQKDLRETNLPAFKACIQEGGAYSIMGAYNRVNGEPCCASKTLLIDILRKEWNFEGYVVSDCGAIEDIFKNHKVVGTGAEAAALAINNGCDLFCCTAIYTKRRKKQKWDCILSAIEQGLLLETTLDNTVKRLFTALFKLGIFDPPECVPFTQIPYEINDCEEHRELALQAARESIVLLKNHENILPLQKDMNSIGLIGPNIDELEVLLGNYSGEPSRYSTFLTGIKELISNKTKIYYSNGCPLKEKNYDQFDEAIEVAQNSDIVIMVLGISNRIEGEEEESIESDFSGDRISLNLPEIQEELLRKIYEIGKPIILVLTGGSALSVNFADQHIPAIIQSWYPGEEGGKAVAEIIFGEYNPAGRLPITFYKSVEELPDFRNYDMDGRTYRYFSGNVLYPFGHGLSYTKFSYSNLNFSSAIINTNETLSVRVDVKNIGKNDGDEVIQLYKSCLNPSFRVPIRELKGFKRIHLKKGELKSVSFTLNSYDLSLVDEEGNRKIFPGEYIISIGGCQPGFYLHEDQIISGKFKINGEIIELKCGICK